MGGFAAQRQENEHLSLRFLGIQHTEAANPAAVRLRIQNKSLNMQRAWPVTEFPLDLGARVGHEALASPHTTVGLTVAIGGATKHLVPTFKPAWMKRVGHLRRWVEKGRLPPETDYDEAVRAIVRCFYFETDQTEKLVRNLRNTLLRIIEDGDDSVALKRADTLLEDLFGQHPEMVVNSPAMNYMFDMWMMLQYRSFQKERPRRAIRGRSTAGILRGVSAEDSGFRAAVTELERVCRAHLPLGAAHLHLGHLTSLRGERWKAAAAYAEARKGLPDSTNFVNTYLVPPESDEALLRVPRLRWMQSSDSDLADPDFPVMLYSTDALSLKRYFPQLVFYMVLFPEFIYHVHVVAEPNEAEEAMDLCADLLNMVLRLQNRPPDAVTLDWSCSQVPKEVTAPITYYACARFLFAPQIMEAYRSNVWIQNMDLLPTGDIRVVPERSQEADVMMRMTRHMNGLIPWRRYEASNIMIRRNANGRAFLDATAQYLRSFLHRENSWYLDQNALVYAVETVPEETTFINAVTIRAPFTQGKFPGFIEA